MKNIIKFILFLIYTIAIFFIKSYYYIIAVLVINVLLMLIYKINFKKSLKNLIKLLPFVIFTIIVNMFFTDLEYAILIGVRLLLVCNVTYTFSKTITYMQFAKVIEDLSYPLKIFKINPKDVSLLISISLCFVPVLKDELYNIRNVLIIKGFKVNFVNIIKNVKLIFRPFCISIMQRVDEMESTLKAKAYQE